MRARVCMQVAKVFTHKIATSRWDPVRLVSSGGMPSSHSALIGTHRTRTVSINMCVYMIENWVSLASCAIVKITDCTNEFVSM